MSSTAPEPLPASGAWRPGQPAGARQFLQLGEVELEVGSTLTEVDVAYETWGRLSPTRDNAVLVLHALTGDSHVVGPAGPGHPTPGWWDGLIGPGRPLDTDRWFVVAPNILGGCQGTTGPSSAAPDRRPWGSRFPTITTRDQVRVEIAWADALGIDSWALVLGGSAGGMRALEWAVTAPGRVQRMLVLASTPEATADQIAWCHTQLLAIRSDPAFRGGDYHHAAPGEGPHRGLQVARAIAHTTYRSGFELDARFGRDPQPGEDPWRGGRFAVQSYLDHQGTKLARRFDAGSYVALTEAMNSHDVGRGRGGVDAALGRITARTAVAAIDSDRLYPVALSEQTAAAIPGALPLRVIASPYGHDGFLLELDEVSSIVTDLIS